MSKNFKIDYKREERIGFQEVIFGASKTIDQLQAIVEDYQKNKQSALITRVQEVKADVLCERYKQNFYDSISEILLIGEFPDAIQENEVAILSGGTSDQFLVNEIYYTLLYFGRKASRYQDIGVAGVHRLLDNIEKLALL